MTNGFDEKGDSDGENLKKMVEMSEPQTPERSILRRTQSGLLREGEGTSRIDRQEGRPFLRSQNVGWGSLLLDDIAFIDDATHEAFNATEIEADDVLLNITGASIGRSAVADARVERGNVNQHVCIIRLKSKEILPAFLSSQLAMQYYQKVVISKQSGATRQAFNFDQIKDFKIIAPPLPLQEKFAAIVQKFERIRRQQREATRQAEHLFQTLLHRAFRGEL